MGGGSHAPSHLTATPPPRSPAPASVQGDGVTAPSSVMVDLWVRCGGISWAWGRVWGMCGHVSWTYGHVVDMWTWVVDMCHGRVETWWTCGHVSWTCGHMCVDVWTFVVDMWTHVVDMWTGFMDMQTRGGCVDTCGGNVDMCHGYVDRWWTCGHASWMCVIDMQTRVMDMWTRVMDMWSCCHARPCAHTCVLTTVTRMHHETSTWWSPNQLTNQNIQVSKPVDQPEGAGHQTSWPISSW